jgi:hypothetical protein
LRCGSRPQHSTLHVRNGTIQVMQQQTVSQVPTRRHKPT